MPGGVTTGSTSRYRAAIGRSLSGAASDSDRGLHGHASWPAARRPAGSATGSSRASRGLMSCRDRRSSVAPPRHVAGRACSGCQPEWHSETRSTRVSSLRTSCGCPCRWQVAKRAGYAIHRRVRRVHDRVSLVHGLPRGPLLRASDRVSDCGCSAAAHATAPGPAGRWGPGARQCMVPACTPEGSPMVTSLVDAPGSYSASEGQAGQHRRPSVLT
jgi:hypothetical protein